MNKKTIVKITLIILIPIIIYLIQSNIIAFLIDHKTIEDEIIISPIDELEMEDNSEDSSVEKETYDIIVINEEEGENINENDEEI